MPSNYELNLEKHNPYSTNKKDASEQIKKEVLTEIPDSVNKVKKRVVRGVIKHDAASDK